ncbi:MAG: ATP-binding protein [Myxococcota bacterium]
MSDEAMLARLERLERRLQRERAARKAAEQIAEEKTRQLYATNGELQYTLGYLTAILDNMADALIVMDTEGQVKMVNHAALETFDATEAEVLGQPLRMMFGAALAEQVARNLPTSAPSHQVELPLPHDRVGMALISSIFAEDEPQRCLGYVTLIRDYTAAKEIDRMKTEFISNVSHELRTPLTSILGFTKIIRRKLTRVLLPTLEANNTNSSPKIQKATQQVRGNIEIIIAEGERLTKLINEVLDVAKMEAGAMDWQMAPLDLEVWVDRVFAASTSLFEGRPVTLVKAVEQGLPTLHGDRDRLIQVLLNLISNAAKFTEEGSVTCTVRLSGAGDAVVVSVSDTGMGISPEEKDLVFDKFRQVGQTLTDKPKGTGLGLPICKQIVTHHGGQIWVESQLGMGSTFSFTLPLDPDHLQPSTQDEPLQLNTAALLEQLGHQAEERGRTVLVVDDEPSIREFLRQELEGVGLAVQEARDGLEAVSQAKGLSPDLIILDVMMPTMNGFDAAAILKNDPQTMMIPIIILSIVEEHERSDRIGIESYLTKPIATPTLLAEVDRLLGQRHHRTILLVTGDGADVTALLETLRESHPNILVEVASGAKGIAHALDLEPDMIIVDPSVPKRASLIQAFKAHTQLEGASLILLTDPHRDPQPRHALTTTGGS